MFKTGKKITGTLYEDLSAFNIVGSDICRANIQNALRCFNGNAFSIRYIVDSHIRMSTIQREDIFAFSLQQS